MRNAILAWYAYSESGAAGTRLSAGSRFPIGDRTALGTGIAGSSTDAKTLGLAARRMNRWFDPTGPDEFGAPEGGAAPAEGQEPVAAVDLPTADQAGLEPVGPVEPAGVGDLFADVRLLDAQVDARGWQNLFSRYGLVGLIDLAKRRGGWPDPTADETVAEAVVGEALDAGYDPVSGLTGAVRRETGRFEPAEADAAGASRN